MGTKQAVKSKILEFKETVVIPAITEFIVKEEFVVGKSGIGYINEDFNRYFEHIIEEPIEDTELRENRLIKNSVDAPIIEKLGGKEEAQTFLAHILYLMNTKLFKDGTVYIFYKETNVFDEDEKYFAYENEKGERVVLRAVYARAGAMAGL